MAIADVILAHITNFAVGFARRVEGGGSQVLGSGVLVTLDGRRGILTAGHVADVYDKLPEIGLVRFIPGGEQQRIIVRHGDARSMVLHSGKPFTESKEVADLAFTELAPDIAAAIEARGVFLNLDKNRERIEAPPPAEGVHCDAMLGLVAEFSDKPFIDGDQWISPMRGVLHTGHVCAQCQGLLTVEAMNENLDQLPESFGGMSGGGLWRIYFVENENESRIVSATLCGVATWQIDKTHIACQGWERMRDSCPPFAKGSSDALRI